MNFRNIKLTETNFAGMPNDQLKQLAAEIEQSVPAGALMIALDRVLARLDKSQIFPKNVDGVKSDPPVIFYSTSPAVLVNLDGDPIWSPIKDNDLRFAVNTNWDLFEYRAHQDVLPPQRQAAGCRRSDIKGPWKAGRQTARQLREAARTTTTGRR